MSEQSELLGSQETAAIAHLYRGEVYRSTAWRQRLDMTTNWAVVTTGIALSLTFATPESTSLPLVLVSLLVAVFLYLEARRYRYFDVFRFRARILEITFYRPMLKGEAASLPQSMGNPLSDDYLRPKFKISFLRAIGKRIRRNYAFIFVIQIIAYVGKLEIHPTALESWSQFIERASIGPISGYYVLVWGAFFHGTWIAIAIYTFIQDRTDTSETKDVLEWGDDEDATGPIRSFDR